MAERAHSLARWGKGILGTAEDDGQLTLELDGHTVSRLRVYRRRCTLEGKEYSVMGIGDLWTDPGYRGQGHAGRLMEDAVALAKIEWQVDIVLHFCLERPVKLYERLGWLRHTGPAKMWQPGGMVPFPKRIFIFAKYFRLSLPYYGASLEVPTLPW